MVPQVTYKVHLILCKHLEILHQIKSLEPLPNLHILAVILFVQ